MKVKSKIRWLTAGLVVSVFLNIFLVIKTRNEMRVVEVADGDTFYLRNGAVVRLAGASAPEYNECLGKEAKQAMEKFVLGRVVRLEGKGHDNYGRVIARVWVGNKAVEAEMIKQGMARIEYAMKTDNEDLKAANAWASSERVGVYGPACTIQAGDERMAKCVIRGNIDDSTKKKYYHIKGCPHYDQVVISLDTGDKCFETEKEAMGAGFVRAAGCK